MKWIGVVALAALVMAIGLDAIPASAANKAICLVCKVKHGESEPETVKAVRTHAGIEYGFCSEECAKAFEAEPAVYLPPEFPRAAPAFMLDDLQGRRVSNQTLKGKVVLLDFWATWCGPCRKAMPELQALHEKYSSRGFTVIGLAVENGADKVKKFTASKKITYPIALDSQKRPAWEAFSVAAVPAAFLLDREGRVVAQWTGSPADGDELEAKLETLLRAD